MFPLSIVRLVKVLNETSEAVELSICFEADFGGGVRKMLRMVDTTPRAQIIGTTLLEWHLSKDVCLLYFRDWSNVPTFGVLPKDYPPAAK